MIDHPKNELIVIEFESALGEKTRSSIHPIAVTFDQASNGWRLTAHDIHENSVRHFPFYGIKRLITVPQATSEIIQSIAERDSDYRECSTMDLRFARVGTRTLLQQRFEVFNGPSEWRDVPGPEQAAEKPIDTSDIPVDTSDIPEANEAFFESAKLNYPDPHPWHCPEPDEVYRIRLLTMIEHMNDPDRRTLSTATGDDLDMIGRRVDVWRRNGSWRSDNLEGQLQALQDRNDRQAESIVTYQKEAKDREERIAGLVKYFEQIGAIFKPLPANPFDDDDALSATGDIPVPADVDHETWRTFRNATNQWLAEVGAITNKSVLILRAIGYMRSIIKSDRYVDAARRMMSPTFRPYESAEPGDVCTDNGGIKTAGGIVPILYEGTIVISKDKLRNAEAFGWRLRNDQGDDLVSVERTAADRRTNRHEDTSQQQPRGRLPGPHRLWKDPTP